MSQSNLLTSRRFGPFFITQFLGAFNDNLFKNALVALVTFGLVNQAHADANTLVNLAAGLFILPFFLFSASAGQLADKFEKSALMRKIKLAEMGIMLIASIGFFLSSPLFLIFILFLMGVQSTFFGPVKYGILPQHLEEHELVGGNGLVEMGTFVAILLGTLLGPTVQGFGAAIISCCLVVVAIAGWWSSRSIPKAPATDAELVFNWNLFSETISIINTARANRTVFLSILGISWFWFFGSTFLTQMPNFARQVLGGEVAVFQLLVSTFVAGIALGSLLCERLSGRVIEIGLVPFGAFGLTAFGVDLYFAAAAISTPAQPIGAGAFLGSSGSIRLCIDLAGIAMFGGFYIVPLYALIQHRSEPSHRSRIIAANNILNAAFMVAAAAVAIALLSSGLSIPELFLVMALMNAAVAFYIFKLVPEFLMRFVVWALIHSIYRLRVKGVENIPQTGPCVVVCNHVSFVDAMIITAACRRPIRFIMYHKIFDMPVMSFVFRVSRAIPIAPRKENPALMEKAFDDVAQSLEAGDVVGIFPEGMITHSGDINTFRNGIEKVIERTPVPVVPLALRGVWGSFFSREDGTAMSKPKRLITRFWSTIELVAGTVVPAEEVTAVGLETAVRELRGDKK